MNDIALVEKKHLKDNLPEFHVGNIVKVHLKVKEGNKTRVQVFQGMVIRKRGTGVSASFTVLKKTRGTQFTVEKIFPLHSPVIEKIEVVKDQRTRRSKVYYVRTVKRKLNVKNKNA